MIRISIPEQFADDHITRIAGEKLRTAILEATQAGEPVEVDFANLIIGSTSFFDEGLAKLAEAGWDTQKFEQLIRFKGLYKLDLNVLNQVRKFRGI